MLKNLSKEEIQRILDEADNIEEVKFDKNSIKRMINQLRQKLNQNQEQRLKYASNPEEFMDSEAALHSSLKEIQVISAFPQYLTDFVKSEGVEALLEVLDHQNPDIIIESVTLLVELTDEDLLSQQQDSQVVEKLIKNEVWNFLIRILSKLNDSDAKHYLTQFNYCHIHNFFHIALQMVKKNQFWRIAKN